MEKKRIVLVDDHVIVRNGLKELIEKLGPYTVSHQFDDGESLLQSLSDLNDVDLIIMDLNMPGKGGLEVVEELKTLNNPIYILVLTLFSEDHTIVQLFRSGVRGFLKKNCSAVVLREALESIFRNGYYTNEYLVLSLENNIKPEKKSKRDEIIDALSDREKEFLKLVCHENEYTYEQIADRMNVKHRTVDGYRESIFEKFDIKSKTGLVLFVLKYQLLEAL